MSIWTFKDIWYNRTYIHIKATVKDSGIRNLINVMFQYLNLLKMVNLSKILMEL